MELIKKQSQNLDLVVTKHSHCISHEKNNTLIVSNHITEKVINGKKQKSLTQNCFKLQINDVSNNELIRAFMN
jgi:hypothetical protein